MRGPEAAGRRRHPPTRPAPRAGRRAVHHEPPRGSGPTETVWVGVTVRAVAPAASTRSTRRTTSPARSRGSPGSNGVGPLRGSPSRRVPLRLPRSVATTPPSAVSGAAGVGRRSPWWDTTIPQSRARPTVTGPPSQDSPTWVGRCAGGRGESQTGPPAEFKDSTGVTAWPTRRRARHCRFTVGSIRPGSPAPRRPHPPAAQAEGRHNQTVPSPRSVLSASHMGAPGVHWGAPCSALAPWMCSPSPPPPLQRAAANLGVSIKGLRDLLRPGGDALATIGLGGRAGLHGSDPGSHRGPRCRQGSAGGRLDGRVYHAMMAARVHTLAGREADATGALDRAQGRSEARPSADVGLSCKVSRRMRSAFQGAAT